MRVSTKKVKEKKSLRNIKVEIPNEKAKAKGIIPLSDEERKLLSERANEKIIFSFNFLDLENELFNLGSMEKRKVPICSEWFITLIQSLKEISNLKPSELKNEQRSHYEFHAHDWDKVSSKFKFDKGFLEQVDGVQFRISSSKGRVHGFMIGNRFYIVWLDPYHNLYPDDRFGGIKYYQKPENCIEKLSQEIIRLKKENNELTELLDQATSNN
ncbi:hypothetical protein ACN077_17120 [Clostridium chromiireducens]|uniref:hypothetical protein n=1 Tax=Clostridium chromiireducens TaxID=225345 RepID=UPI003AF7C3A8